MVQRICSREAYIMSKIIRITQIKMPVHHTEEEVLKKALWICHIKEEEVRSIYISRQSVDARRKPNIYFQYSVDIEITSDRRIHLPKNSTIISPVLYRPKITGNSLLKGKIAVIGAGPAGLFCTYQLALAGYCPVLIERGKKVEERQQDIEKFWETGVLNGNSNVQFGEGGAGTFSDGKLNTQIKDKFGRNRFVLETLVRFGAPGEILYQAKPHIGTDVLSVVLKNMREELLSLGVEILFETQVVDFLHQNGRICKLLLSNEMRLSVGAVVLAIGHSARDTFEILYQRGIQMEAKSFAVGFRIEHDQSLINTAQYGEHYDKVLPSADYKLTYQTSGGRGVYSFCMCPGGFVVDASSEKNRLAINGMSYHARDSKKANSAIVVTVSANDFSDDSPLSGMMFQRKLEEKAYRLGKGLIPQQTFGSFERNETDPETTVNTSCIKGCRTWANLRTILPEERNADLLEAIHAFGKKIEGFDRENAILSGIESRTSSPIRIPRNDEFQGSIQGIYPCGEGAGYAGGITSAAMDGLKVAEAIMKKYKNN